MGRLLQAIKVTRWVAEADPFHHHLAANIIPRAHLRSNLVLHRLLLVWVTTFKFHPNGCLELALIILRSLKQAQPSRLT